MYPNFESANARRTARAGTHSPSSTARSLRTSDASGASSGSYGGEAPDNRPASLASEGQGSHPATLLPPVDIFEDETGITVIADMPGVSRENLGVRVTGDNLVIEGSASIPATGDMELLYGEVLHSHYRRSFTLSRELDPGKIDARLVNGVLKLTIHKAEEAKPRRIQVSVG